MKIDRQSLSPDGSAAAFAAGIEAGLAPLADPRKAAGMVAYMQHRFEFHDIQAPDRRRTTLPAIRSFAGLPSSTS